MTPGPRHVALNALWLDPGRSSGTETYLRGLVPALARARPDLRLTLATTRRGAAALVAEGWTDFCAVVRVPTDEGERPRRLVAELVRFPDLARRRGADLLHSLANTGPAVTPAPHVLTLHDVTYVHHATMPRSTILATRAIVGASSGRAARIITGSERARDDLVATLGLPAARIAVVPHGAGRPPSVDPAPSAPLLERLGTPPRARIVLCVAALRPHKNQELLVRALEHLPGDVVLVLAGHEEDYAAALRRLATDLGLAARVRFAGYVADAELETLYAVASCAAFPTLAEGFGLPVLEAMRRGAPVACSELPVLREVGGDVPHYFDPRDAAGAAAAIGAALAEPRNAPQALAQAARFTWEAAAEGTLAAYEQALAASAR